MAAGTYNLTLEQGATLRQNLLWKDSVGNPVNLTGFTARLQARISFIETTTFINLTTENGGITLGGTAGTIELYLSSTATAAIIVKKGVYDLELVAGGGDVIRLLEGKITIKPEVTR